MLSKLAARRLMLEKQGISPHTGLADKEAIFWTVDRLGCLQIDTINVIERAQYLTLWTRLGWYKRKHLDELAYRDRLLFEHWAHAACYIPLKDYRFYLRSMEERRKDLEYRLRRRTGKGTELVDMVLERIKDEGPLGSIDFEGPKRKGGWWNWKPAKVALEYLLGAGILLIHHRDNFQRYYDLAENFLPPWVNTEPPSDSERVRFFILRTLDALGTVKASDIREYYHHWSIKLGQTTRQLEETLLELVADGTVERKKVEDEKAGYYLLGSDSVEADFLADDWGFDDVRLFNYFDNLMWNRGRIETLFGFQPKLEVYLPVDQRVYGYYHMPVLYGDKFVARVEPKLERVESKLKVRGYWLEKGFKSTEEYVDKLEETLQSLAQFTGADAVEWTTS